MLSTNLSPYTLSFYLPLTHVGIIFCGRIGVSTFREFVSAYIYVYMTERNKIDTIASARYSFSRLKSALREDLRGLSVKSTFVVFSDLSLRERRGSLILANKDNNTTCSLKNIAGSIFLISKYPSNFFKPKNLVKK